MQPKQENSNIGEKLKVSLSISAFLLIASILGLHLKLFWFKLEPVHIFLINFFGSSATAFLAICLNNVLIIFPFSELCPQNFFHMFTQTSASVSVLLIQMDRFRAIYWNSLYKDKVTNNRAVLECLTGHLCCSVITGLWRIFFPEYRICAIPDNLLITKPANIASIGLLKISAFLSTIGIMIYIKYMDRKLELEKVTPNIQLPAVEGQVEMEPVHDVDAEDTMKKYLLMLRKTKITNLMFFPFLLTTLPIVILGMVFVNCDQTRGECDNFNFFFSGLVACNSICLFLGYITIALRLFEKL